MSADTATRRQAAASYLTRGIAVIPVPAGEKNPNRPGWQGERLTTGDVPRCWTNGQNVGLLTGEPSAGRVDADLDADEAVAVAGRFLPPTLTSGRESRPHSHWWYSCPDAESRDWKDTDSSKLVELRATGRQTLVWPSTHPSGDGYLWHGEGVRQRPQRTPAEGRADPGKRHLDRGRCAAAQPHPGHPRRPFRCGRRDSD